MINRDELLKRIVWNIEHIGTSPEISLKLLKKTSEKEYSAEDLAEIIGIDATVAAQVLKKANSAYYHRGGTCSTIIQAVVKLGSENIKKIIFAIEMIGKYNSNCANTFFDEKTYWKHSLAGAMIASKYAATENIDKDTVYFAALIRNLSVLAIRQYTPFEFEYIMKIMNEYQFDFENASEMIIGESHKKIMHMIGCQWQLPMSINNAIGSNNDVNGGDNEAKDIKRSIAFADDLLSVTSFEKWDNLLGQQLYSQIIPSNNSFTEITIPGICSYNSPLIANIKNANGQYRQKVIPVK
ncbi:MAG: HDOD domain-containing protein [Spirochaetes bacterium]|nr:HDOD domain-containing protein [Spirochaetota bacterium]